MRGGFFSFDHPELVLLPIKIISRALISSQSEKVMHARRIGRGVPPSSFRAPPSLFISSNPSPTPPIGEPPPTSSPIHVLPAPIILTQPPIDRIQARRIAEYRRNVAEVGGRLRRLRTYVNVVYPGAHAMLIYVRHTYARIYEVPN